MVLRAAFLTFRYLVEGGACAEELAFSFNFLGVAATIEGPSFSIFFIPPFLGLSTSNNTAHISSVKGRKPETTRYL